MSKKEKEQTVSIDGTEYKVADLTETQVTLVNHVTDLDRKISSSKFNLDQLTIGRNACMEMLVKEMEEEAD